MKTTASVIAALLLCGALPAAAGLPGDIAPAVRGYGANASAKLARGATNLARSVTEFYVQPRKARRESGEPLSMLYPGIGEAFGRFLTRALGGGIELILFPVPFPNGWKPLLHE